MMSRIKEYNVCFKALDQVKIECGDAREKLEALDDIKAMLEDVYTEGLPLIKELHKIINAFSMAAECPQYHANETGCMWVYRLAERMAILIDAERQC